MTLCARAVLPYARLYALRAGTEAPESLLRARVERAAAGMPAWARALAAGAALAVRWLSPLLILGIPRRADALAPERFDEILSRLQRARWLAVKGPLFALKTIVLPACYGGLEGRR